MPSPTSPAFSNPRQHDPRTDPACRSRTHGRLARRHQPGQPHPGRPGCAAAAGRRLRRSGERLGAAARRGAGAGGGRCRRQIGRRGVAGAGRCRLLCDRSAPCGQHPLHRALCPDRGLVPGPRGLAHPRQRRGGPRRQPRGGRPGQRLRPVPHARAAARGDRPRANLARRGADLPGDAVRDRRRRQAAARGRCSLVVPGIGARSMADGVR